MSDGGKKGENVKYSFLIIEDKDSHIGFYKEAIINASEELSVDWEIEVSKNYSDSEKKLTEKKYDIIIMDRKLGSEESIDLINSVKDKHPFQKIIFITAYSTDKTRREVRERKIYEYIEKKGDYRKKLIGAIKNLLEEQISVFVILPYSDIHLRFYYDVLAPYMKQLGFKPILAKDIISSSFLLEDIIRGIETSYFLICDLSEENMNVYYELGRAHQMKKEVILIVNNSLKQLPSDLRGFRYIRYSLDDLEGFKSELLKKISEIEIKSLKS